MIELTEFIVIYDGDALQTHSMDVKDLAPALLALGNLFDEANRILNGDKVNIKLHIKAYEVGSFQVFLAFSQSFASQISNFLTGDFITSVINLKELIFIGVGSLFWIIKKVRGKKPNKIIPLKNDLVRLEFENESFDVPVALLKMYQELSIRRAVEAVVKPLHNDGIDYLKIMDQGEILESVTKSELDYFTVPEIPEEEIVSSESEQAYSIVSLSFKDKNKWRLSDGDSVITAAILDEDFKKKVDQNIISFSKGDILKCLIRTKQFRTASGLKTEYQVLHVKEHILAYKQTTLF